MKKRGISPLIATVLIIGLTIALAAIIMTWGTDLFDRITGQTDYEMERLRVCTTEMSFKITNVDCNLTMITIDNRGRTPIKALRIRITTPQGTDVKDIDTSQYSGVFPLGPGFVRNINLSIADPNITLDDTVTKLGFFATVPSTEAGGQDFYCDNSETIYNLPCS